MPGRHSHVWHRSSPCSHWHCTQALPAAPGPILVGHLCFNQALELQHEFESYSHQQMIKKCSEATLCSCALLDAYKYSWTGKRMWHRSLQK